MLIYQGTRLQWRCEDLEDADIIYTDPSYGAPVSVVCYNMLFCSVGLPFDSVTLKKSRTVRALNCKVSVHMCFFL